MAQTRSGLGHERYERIGNLVGVLDGYTDAGGFHPNVNVLDRVTVGALLRRVDRGGRAWYPVRGVPGRLSAVQRVEVLRFHRLGSHKYAALGHDFPLAATEPPTPTEVERARSRFRSHGLSVH